MKPILLIAESDAELRDIYQQFLTQRGFKVETAADGLDCLEKIRHFCPTVLVLDRELLWGGGDGILAWLREQEGPTGAAVVLTATAGCPEENDAIRPPVVRQLAKPFSLAVLSTAVRAALDENRKKEKEQRYLNRSVAGLELFGG